ncbi:dihydroorotase [Thioalkalivibrio paradoxus]|uniref:Dihydroorotase n=1 Tax=Thioalkalivibrio paradoxus ARh 1 TaxID=713585 RepID=W0DRQ8_9GAMM|nr:dihydroorotase [Thioalkalivibrio paradoxus]AHE99545.1 dihydroorotase [Thioalkalivibrio paradoxus ARh 1]
MSVLVEQARILDPASGFDAVAPLCVQGSEILAVGTIPEGFEPRRRIDARGRWLFPGLVDLAAHLREPGEEHKATIASETLAAARGGITTLVMPPDTDPPVDSPAEVELISRRAEQACGVRVLTIGALTRGLQGEQLAEMAALKRAGVVAVGNAGRSLSSPLVLRRALEYAATFDLMVALSAQDTALAGSGCVHEGAVSTRLGLPGIPEAAETAALGTILALVEQTGARVHIQRLSTRRAAEMIAKARADGLPVSADVAAHQLFLTEIDVADFNPLCHVNPPLRTQRDREALREAVARGDVAAICSDHQPHESDSKLGPFAETRPGISALETLLPLTLRLAEEGLMELSDALARVTIGPAAILGASCGRLAAGSRADFVLFDPEALTHIRPETWLSAGANTPFFGWTFSGRVIETWVSGRPAWTTPVDEAA